MQYITVTCRTLLLALYFSEFAMAQQAIDSLAGNVQDSDGRRYFRVVVKAINFDTIISSAVA